MAENFAAFGTPIDIGASTPLAPPDFSRFASPINIGNSTPLDAGSEPLELAPRRDRGGVSGVDLPAGDLGPAFTYPRVARRPSSPSTSSEDTLLDYPTEFGKGFAEGGKNLAAGALKGYGAMAPVIAERQIEALDQINAPPLDDSPEERAAYRLRRGVVHPSADIIAERRAALEARRDTPIEDQPLYRAGHAIEEFGKDALKAKPGWEKSWTRDIGSGFGSMAGGVATSLVPGVGPAMAATVFLGAGMGEAVDRAIREGATPEEAKRAAELGTLAGATDMVDALLPALGSTGKALGLIRRVGTRTIFGALAEGGQEGLQQVIQNWIAQGVYKPDQDLSEDVPRSIAIGMIVGGVTAGGFSAVEHRREARARAGAPASIPDVQPLPGDIEPTAVAAPPVQPGIPASAPAATAAGASPLTPADIPAGAVPSTTILPEAPDDRADRLAQPVQGAGGAAVRPDRVVQEPQAGRPAPVAQDQAGAGVVPPVVSPPAPSPGVDLGPRDTLQSLLDDPRSAAEIRAEIARARAEAETARNWRPTAEWEPIPRGALAMAGEDPGIELRQDKAGNIVARIAPAPGTREAPVPLETPADVHAGAEQTAPAPSPAQADAGNYAKRHVRWQGFDISIENEAGSTRTGIGKDGRPWSVVMPAPYGYFRNSTARDGDSIDVYIGPNPQSGKAFVIDQIDLNGRYDEAKIVIGVSDQSQARQIYEAGFSDGSGPSRIGGITELSVEELKAWLARGDTKRALTHGSLRREEALSEPRVSGGIPRLEGNESALQQSERDRIQELRSSRRKGVPGVGPELPTVPTGHGAEALVESLPGTTGQQQRIRTRERGLGSEGGARLQYEEKPLGENGGPRNSAINGGEDGRADSGGDQAADQAWDGRPRGARPAQSASKTRQSERGSDDGRSSGEDPWNEAREAQVSAAAGAEPAGSNRAAPRTAEGSGVRGISRSTDDGATMGSASGAARNGAQKEIREGMVSGTGTDHADKYPSAKKAPQARSAISLTQFLAARGGLRPDPGGELKALGLTGKGGRMVIPGLGYRNLVRPQGMTLDEAREAAVEAGYLHDPGRLPGGGLSQTTPNDLLRLISEEMAGRRGFAPGDEAVDRDAQAARRREEEEVRLADAVSDVRAVVQGNELLATEEQIDQAARLVLTTGEEADEAIFHVLERAAIAEVGDAAQNEPREQSDAREDVRAGAVATGQGRAAAVEQPSRQGGAEDAAAPGRVEPGEDQPGGTGAAAGTERTATGEQHVLPGAERVAPAEQAQRGAEKPLKPKVAQRPADEGLFGDGDKQTDLVDMARAVGKSSGVRRSQFPRQNPFSPSDDLVRSIRIEVGGSPHEYFGLRVESEREIKPGDTVPDSRVWDDGTPTDEKLDGTATIGLGDDVSDAKIAQALEDLAPYVGGRLVLVGGRSFERGADDGEHIIRRPRAVAVWPSQNGQKPQLPAKPVDLPALRDYARSVVGDKVRSVTLVGSTAEKGEGQDVDLLYDLGDIALPTDADEIAQELAEHIETIPNLDIDRYDTFLKVGDRYFHVAIGAGREIVENTEYAKEQAGKPAQVLAAESTQKPLISEPDIPGLVERIPGEDGTEVLIVKNADGQRFNVVFRDADAQQTVGFGPIMPTLERARAKAREMLKSPEHPGLVIKSLETGKETTVQPAGTRPPARPAPTAPSAEQQALSVEEASKQLAEAHNRQSILRRRLDGIERRLEEPPKPRNSGDKIRIEKNRAVQERIARSLRKKEAVAMDAVDDARAALERAKAAVVRPAPKPQAAAPAAHAPARPEPPPPTEPPSAEMPDIPESLRRKPKGEPTSGLTAEVDLKVNKPAAPDDSSNFQIEPANRVATEEEARLKGGQYTAVAQRLKPWAVERGYGDTPLLAQNDALRRLKTTHRISEPVTAPQQATPQAPETGPSDSRPWLEVEKEYAPEARRRYINRPGEIRAFLNGALAAERKSAATQPDGPEGTERHELFLAFEAGRTFAKTKITLTATPGTETGPSDSGPQIVLAHALLDRLASGKPVTAKTLQDEATKAFGGTAAEGKFDRKAAYDALETAVNMLIKRETGMHIGIYGEGWQAPFQKIEKLLASLPTQTVRSEEQVSFQQFSTPPHYALAVAYAANLRDGDVVLEPSAGTGSIVAAATRPGVKIIANELSERRADLLSELVGPDGQVFTENAEQINNVLPKDIRPTVVVMNPPFSQTAGRMGDKKDIMVGANHIEQALKRLAPGGRLVAIVGRGMTMGSPRFREWWQSISRENSVRANIGVDGSVYGKYGTTFGTRLLVIDKVAPTGDKPVLTEAQTVDDLMRALEPIRDGRPAAEPKPAQPRSPEVAEASQVGRPAAQPPSPQPGVAGAGGRGDRGVAAGEPPRPGGPGRPDVRVGAEERPGVPAVEPGGRQRPGAGTGTGAATRAEPEAGRGTGAEPTVQPDAGRTAQPPAGGERIELEHAAPGTQATAEISDNLYEPYEPKQVRIKGAARHPGPLVESAAMASVDPPTPTYRPALPAKVISEGRLSLPQIEAVVYAGQAHEKMLPAGEGETPRRKGFFIGDGTGTGKGRMIAGIILDNWQQGRTKAVWVSEKRKLLNDAKRDWTGLGQDGNLIFNVGKTKTGEAIKSDRGIGFVTYDTLKGGMSDQAALARGGFARGEAVKITGQGIDAGRTAVVAGKAIKKKGSLFQPLRFEDGTKADIAIENIERVGEAAELKSRVDQLVDWLGADFDGVIAFDECVPAGTMIATPTGPRPIEQLKIGDTVYGFDHASERVVATSVKWTFRRRTQAKLHQISSVSMTGNHPVWTKNRGYIDAAKILMSDTVMYISQHDKRTHMRELRRGFSSEEESAEVLQHVLQKQIDRKAADTQAALGVDDPREARPGIQGAPATAEQGTQNPEISARAQAISQIISQSLPQSEGDQKPDGGLLPSAGRERQETADCSPHAALTIGVGGGISGWCCPVEGGMAEVLSDRHRGAEPSDCRGSGRLQPSRSAPASQGQEEGHVPPQARMDGSAVLEFGGYGQRQPSGGENIQGGGIEVFNIETGTANYFANSLLVHNCHNMSNAVATKEGGREKDAAQKALAGLLLQERLPNARVVYVSATGATEVANLAYADRLGLWGRGTPFASRNNFIAEVEQGGIAAMELIARDMKQLGLYLARNLSYDGVEYDRVEHRLDANQREIYDTLADAWQVVLRNINEALETTNGNKDWRARSAAASAFWSAHQRFFNQVVTSLQMPSVIAAVEKDFDAGRQAVLQLTNTNEAAQERAAAKAETAEDIEDLDITPRDQIIQLVERAFPTQEYEEYIDEDGKKRVRPVTDSNGKPVENADAVAMRDALIEKLSALKVPQGPLDMILDHFGVENVAEVTGRGRRFVLKPDERTGESRRVEESRPGSSNQAETDAFQAGKKKVLVFSEAGGTGASYHADNQSASKGARRSHYLVQAGWRADKAVQGFGRTHRTNQGSAPIFHLVTTDLDGQKRFISSIARRLGQLGALTKGQRQAGDQGIFSARDNLESREARDALRQFLTDVVNGRADGIDLQEFEQQTGLALQIKDAEGRVLGTNTDVPITQFLNRLLSLKIDLQNRVFSAFSEKLDAVIEERQRAGLLDVGMETVRADRVTKDSEKPVHTDKESGAETKYVKLTLADRFKPTRFSFVAENKARKIEFWVTSPQGKVYGVAEAPNATKMDGSIVEQYRLIGPVSAPRLIPRSNVTGRDVKWAKIDRDRAAKLWQAETDAAPEFLTRDLHLITGAILPIWDRLKGNPRVVRLQTEAGERLIGRVVPEQGLAETLRALGAEAEGKKVGPDELFAAVMRGGRARLANGWVLKRALVAGEQRIELVGPSSFSEGQQVKADGAFTERIAYETRYFVPVDPEQGAKVLGRLTEHRPVVETTGPRGEALAEDGLASGGGAKSAPFSAEPFTPAQDAPLGRSAQEHVVQRGREDGLEHVVAIDGGGSVLLAGRGRSGAVGFPDDLADALDDAQRSIVLHHNHPNGSSLSMQDIATLARRGLVAVWAHGHDGTVVRGSLTPEAKEALDGDVERLWEIAREARGMLLDRLRAPIATGRLTLPDGNWLLAHLTAVVMHNAGIIDYRSNLDTSRQIARFGLQSTIKKASNAAARSIFNVRQSRNGRLPDRRAGSLRHPGDMGASFERDQGISGRGTVEGSRDQGRGGDDSSEEKARRGLKPPDEDGLSSISRPVPGLYSAVLRAVEGMKLPKAPAAQWLNTLRNAPGVKQEELDWIGLADWLKEQNGPVTKEAVADYVRANQIEVREVEKGAPRALADNEFQSRYDQLLEAYEEEKGRPPPHDGVLRAWADEQASAERYEQQTKFSSYALPGGENYRELLLTLPGDRTDGQLPPGYSVKDGGPGNPYHRWQVVRPDGRHVSNGSGETREDAIANALRGGQKELRWPTEYRSAHWDEPNVLAHVRFDDRVIDGKKTLHIAEVQSDWLQTGRKRGFKGVAEPGWQLRFEGEYSPYSEAAQKGRPLHFTVRDEDGGIVGNIGAATEEDARKQMESGNFDRPSAVPNAPFKTSWETLALKRMVRYASENGYEQISWDTGATNAERFDLSKQLEHIRYRQNKDGTYRLDATPKGESILRDIADNVPADKLADHVGKDVAEKIVAGEGQADRHGNRTIEGVDLKIGGEGQIGFYDRILPAAANKLGKKFGAKVEDAEIGAPRWMIEHRDRGHAVVDTQGEAFATYATRAEAEELLREFEADAPPIATKVHILPITPEMRAAAMTQGFPLFRQGAAGLTPKARQRRADIESRLTDLVRKLTGKGTEVVFHGGQSVDLGIKSPGYGNLEASPGSITAGMYITADRIIHLALGAPDQSGAFHEAWHDIEFHLLADREVDLLKRETERLRPIAAKRLGLTAEQAKELAGYEVRAYAFEAYADARAAGRTGFGMHTGVARIFGKILAFLRSVRNALSGMGFKTTEDIFESGYQGSYAGRPDRGTRSTGSLASRQQINPTTATAQQRAQASQGFIARGQPIDRAIRVPFDWFGGTTADGKWDPGLALWNKQKPAVIGAGLGAGIGATVGGPVGAAAGAVVGGAAGKLMMAEFSPQGRFAFLNPLLETVRSGLIDRYNLRNMPEYVARERRVKLDKNAVLLRGAAIMENLQNHAVGPEEARVLQAILTGEDVSDTDMQALAEPIRAAIDQLGQEAVALGLLSRESFERNRGAYLHRVYRKYEEQQNGLTRMVNKIMAGSRHKIIGNQFKGRGIFHDVTLSRLMRDVPDWHEGARGTPAKGERFIRLDELGPQVEMDLDGDPPPERVIRTVWWPADRAIPDRYSAFRKDGPWELRGETGGRLVLWRDFTKAERVKMGEILDARYTIAKTFMLMAHDLATGRFYKDIAENEDWASKTKPEGTIADAGEWRASLGAHRPKRFDWVHVPDTAIPNSGGKKRFGALAGMYVREEIWRDFHEMEVMQNPQGALAVWRTLMTQWKLNHTARSPTVHMNNVMSNFLFMDLADIRMQDLIAGLRAYAKGDSNYQEAFEHGAFGADVISNEIRDNVLKPILEEIARETMASPGRLGMLGQVSKFTDILMSKLKTADRYARWMYQVEDEVFRMATYMRRRQLGDDAYQAAQAAREQFVDYDIRAPWVRVARNSVLPFISYTYRAAPLVAKAVATRPWKLAKYFGLAYAANALAYALTGGDEDKERRSLRDREQGRNWLGGYNMTRMPFNDPKHGLPLFLDTRRWVPAGDIFSMGDGDIPAWMNIGGPILIGAELALNRSMFLGKDIFNSKTDDWWDRQAKRADYLYKGWTPSAAYIPGSWYWENISKAVKGGTDREGRPYSFPLAVASSVGIKLKPQDVEGALKRKAEDFARIERALKFEGRLLTDQRNRNLISESEYNRGMDALRKKAMRNRDKAAEATKESVKEASEAP